MRAALLLSLACLVGCGRLDAVERGRQLFADPSLGGAGNAFSCATCHESALPPKRLLPGYPLVDVAARAAWWGGTVPNLLEAVDQCLVQFTRGRELDPADERGRALFVYLRSLSSGAAGADGGAGASLPPLPLTVVRTIDAAYGATLAGGDPSRGRSVWDAACRTCHGEAGTGAGRIAASASVVPGDTVRGFGAEKARLIVVEKVRHGKFYGISGTMPLFSLEALADAQLADLLAYLVTLGLPPS